jgi:hypothetical protein
MANRKPVLLIPETATREQLVDVLDKLAYQGLISIQAVNEALEDVTLETRERITEQVDATITKETKAKELSPERKEKLLETLKDRFEKNMKRHLDIQWAEVHARLNESVQEKLWSLSEMNRTGGEPDVVGLDQKTGEYIFEDRSAQSPRGRRNLAYDKEVEDFVRNSRPEIYCAGNAVDMAKDMGITILDESRYRAAQEEEKQASGKYMDSRTSNLVATPVDEKESGYILYGYSYGGDLGCSVHQANYYTHLRHDTGFRGSLRV